MELIELSKKVDSIKKELSEQSVELKQIRDALLGNEFNEKNGIINQVKDHEDRLEAMEKKWNKMIWLAIGAGIGGGITISKIISLIAQSIAK